MANKFSTIYAKIQEIPYGKVSSYGLVAQACGNPKGARMVGWALGALGLTTDIPWHRVVGKDGKLTITNRHVSPKDQQQRLAQEGVETTENSDGIWITNPDWHTFTP